MRNRTITAVVAGATTATLLLAACGPGFADGEGRPLRIALNQSEAHPSYIALDHLGEALAETTEGYDTDIYPNETLGAQAEALQLVSDGSVDMAVVSGPQLENLNPDFVVFNLPRVFDDVEHQMRVIHDPEITGDLFSSLEERNNITVLGGFTQGARSVYTDEPIETPADLAGKQIRVQESDLQLAMARALGGIGTPLAYGELYTGLQSGVVDAAENNEVSYFTQRHFEVAPYWSYTNHLVGLDYIIINSDLLASMTPADREAFDAAFTAAHEEHTQLWAEATQEAIEGATAGGATFSEVDDAAFAEPLEAMADTFITTDSQRALYDAARAAAQP
ncbi:TRAP transporter substrate-binding protein [Litorihabitans aurantiacus]|uniref:C4-dicarboxylate ABC transporter substrate-binding protein n=1 Tax=Litorihabitans aurantiacus TaxID=1930061 RepID=A0AA37XH19_9MICO|nr:TRAP transporter substrate-binding protein [Litorihabitans aurantiacus]GMA33391.1 C4-dicarboxylate ABC transporter substrate-binding protein [Litorihabitans aurantiacus]